MSTNFTIYEYNSISDAICCASTHLDTAYTLLSRFQEEYMDCDSNRKELAVELMTYPEKIDALIRVIVDQLFEAKKEIDVYTNIESPAVRYILREAEEKRHIIEMYKNARQEVS